MTDATLSKLCEDFDKRLERLNDAAYIDACERISAWFEACAFAKRDDMQALEHAKFTPRSTQAHTIGPECRSISRACRRKITGRSRKWRDGRFV